MQIFQPDRYLLKKEIAKVGHFIHGRTLDVGAGGFDRYQNFFKTSEYIRMDRTTHAGIDVVGSIYEIPFPNDSFDSVVCTQVLEHVSRPLVAVQEMVRVLKVGGYILVTVPQLSELHEEPHDYFRYTKFGLVQIFADSGLELVCEEQRGGFFSVRAQVAIRYAIDTFALYDRPFLGRIAKPFLKAYGMTMLWLDSLDTSQANRKHTIGWTMVAKKK